MLVIILSVLLAISIAIDIQQARYRRRLVKNSSRLIGNLHKENQHLFEVNHASSQNYKALELGTQEIIDNYENDFLDFRHKIAAATNSAAYDRELREEAEKKIERINEVIELHSTTCDSIIDDLAKVLVDEIAPKDE